ncbi:MULTISPECIES: rhodanese-like domain-containing protein [Dasania]|uniref:rhodanese-like domain-containing protein n=1 Tax=Dasania TaxID=503005 RepID=UPI002814DCBF|nr:MULTISPECIES: rhodanese-like domain-containing protein [Dasania]
MNYKRIDAKQFKALQETKPQLCVVDVRSAAEVNNECLAGSLHLPLHDFNDSSLAQLLSSTERSEGEDIYLLCGSGQRAQMAVSQLADKAECCVVVEGGIAALKQAGAALEQGTSKVISLERQVRIAAGSLVLVGVVLGSQLTPYFYALSAFVGAGLVFAGITNTCGMGILLSRMPWNQAK